MRLTKPILYFIPLAITSIVYWSSLSFDFAWLDQYEILDGALIINSWQEFFTVLFSNDGNFPGYHRPMYNLIHTIDLSLWGENAFGFHLSSVFLHLLNTTLLITLMRMFKLDKWLIFFIALLWALAPHNAASVALIHSKADLLSTSFLLLGMIGYKKGKGGLILFLSCLGFILAILSKEVAVAGVVLTGIYFWWTGGRKGIVWASLGLPLVLFVALKLASGGSTFAEIENYGLRLATFPLVYGSYFFETMTSVRLSISDAVWAIGAGDLTESVLYGVMAISAVTIQVLLWRRIPETRAFILVFNIFLLPVSQIVPTLHFRADRFLYAASIGWWGMMVSTLFHFVDRQKLKIGLASVILVAMMLRVVFYLPVFENDESLFSYTVDHHPECREAHSYLGMIRMEEQNYSSSLAHFSKALNNNPKLFSYVDRTTVRANVGTVRMRNGQYRYALDEFLKVIDEVGPSPSLDLNLGICYKMLGQAQKAFEHLVSYQNVYPDELKGMEKMAEVYVDLGRKNKAIEELNKILRLYPDHPNRSGINAALQSLYNAPR